MQRCVFTCRKKLPWIFVSVLALDTGFALFYKTCSFCEDLHLNFKGQLMLFVMTLWRPCWVVARLMAPGQLASLVSPPSLGQCLFCFKGKTYLSPFALPVPRHSAEVTDQSTSPQSPLLSPAGACTERRPWPVS